MVGPEDLPKVAVWLGRMIRRLRSLIRDLKEESGWNNLEREMTDTKRDIDRDLRSIQSDVNTGREIEAASEEVSREMRKIDTKM